MTVTPGLLDILDSAIEADRRELHTCMPAEVLRVQTGDHKRQFVDVQPLLRREVPTEDGELVSEQLPALTMVPVGHLQGGGFFISVPLAAGDIVLLVFAERSLDQWLQVAKKGTTRTVDPGDVGLHTLAGAVALPCGPAPRQSLLQDVDGSALVIGLDGGSKITIQPDGEVHLAGNGDAVALASLVLDRLNAIKSTFDAHTHVYNPGPSPPVPTATPASPMPTPAAVGSAKVKLD